MIENKGFGQREEMRCIVFIERKLTPLALHYLTWKLELVMVVDVVYCYSSNANRKVNDAREIEEVNKENATPSVNAGRLVQAGCRAVEKIGQGPSQEHREGRR